MKLYATVSSERASKGQGGNEYIDVDLFGDKHDGPDALLARLVLMVDANNPKKYVLVEDVSYRSHLLTIKCANVWGERIETKGERQKGEKENRFCVHCGESPLAPWMVKAGITYCPNCGEPQ